MTDNSKRTGPALEAHYRFLLWLIQATEKFPRSHKLTNLYLDAFDHFVTVALQAPYVRYVDELASLPISCST